MPGQIKTCFVSAPISVNTYSIKNLFEERGIEVLDALSISPGTGSIISAIETSIRKADLFCAILPPSGSSNILFEIGIAFGTKKPIFLIVDKNADLPLGIADLFYVRANPSDIDAIKFNLDQFLNFQSKTKHSRYEFAIGPHFSKIWEDPEINELNDVIEKDDFVDNTSHWIANILKKGNLVVQESKDPNIGADLAIWLEETESSLGNPILIEVKSGLLSETILTEAENQLRNYLINTNTKTGILIYSDTLGLKFESSAQKMPLVIRLNLRDFISHLSNDQLAKALLDERNRAIHGGLS